MHNTTVSSIRLPKSSTADVSIIILRADTPCVAILAKHGDYHSLYHSMFERAVAGSGAELGSARLILESFDVVNGPLPSLDQISRSTAVMITGSTASAASSIGWIDNLKRLIRQTYWETTVRLIGICFGHQVICSALGGTVVRNEAGWEIGVPRVRVTDTGRRIFRTGRPHLNISQIHKDVVTELPSRFERWGESDKTTIQGAVEWDTSNPGMPADLIRVLTFQGHPEFTNQMVDLIYTCRAPAFTAEFRDAGLRRAPDEEQDDGIVLARTMLAVFGVGAVDSSRPTAALIGSVSVPASPSVTVSVSVERRKSFRAVAASAKPVLPRLSLSHFSIPSDLLELAVGSPGQKIRAAA